MRYPTETNIAMRWIIASTAGCLGLILFAVILFHAEPLRQRFLVSGESPVLFFLGLTIFTLAYGAALSFSCALFSSGTIRITIAGKKIT